MNLTEEGLHLMSPLSQDEGAPEVETLVLADVLQPAPFPKNMGSIRKTMRTVMCKTKTTRVWLYKITDSIGDTSDAHDHNILGQPIQLINS